MNLYLSFLTQPVILEQVLVQGLEKQKLIQMKLIILNSPKDWVRWTIQRQNLYLIILLPLQIGIET